MAIQINSRTAADERAAMLDGFLECAFWSSVDDDGAPLAAHYGPEDMDPESMERARAIVDGFHRGHRGDLITHRGSAVPNWDGAGHDLWLTMNRHGAGFWDRYYGPDVEVVAAGERLTAAAHAEGTADLMVCDDGTVQLVG